MKDGQTSHRISGHRGFLVVFRQGLALSCFWLTSKQVLVPVWYLDRPSTLLFKASPLNFTNILHPIPLFPLLDILASPVFPIHPPINRCRYPYSYTLLIFPAFSLPLCIVSFFHRGEEREERSPFWEVNLKVDQQQQKVTVSCRRRQFWWL